MNPLALLALAAAVAIVATVVSSRSGTATAGSPSPPPPPSPATRPVGYPPPPGQRPLPEASVVPTWPASILGFLDALYEWDGAAWQTIKAYGWREKHVADLQAANDELAWERHLFQQANPFAVELYRRPPEAPYRVAVLWTINVYRNPVLGFVQQTAPTALESADNYASVAASR